MSRLGEFPPLSYISQLASSKVSTAYDFADHADEARQLEALPGSAHLKSVDPQSECGTRVQSTTEILAKICLLHESSSQARQRCMRSM